MKKTSNKIVFFGSGPVAAESLRLLQAHADIEAVVTKKSTEHEMKTVTQNAPVFTVNNRAELDELISNTKFTSNLGVLIDFGIIVSQSVIDAFELGIINSHFSLLPEWRGADPISFSILSGQAKTGVSLMVIDEGMDTGKIITQKSLPIEADETTPSLTSKLITLSNNLLEENIPLYTDKRVKPRQQPHPDRATYSRKLTKEDGVLDFNKPAEVLEREIRAFIDWPKSRTTIAGKDVVITKAATMIHSKGVIGEAFVLDGKKIGIYTASGVLVIHELKPAGKKAMNSEAFLAGHKL